MATTITGTTIDVGTNVIVTDSAGKVGIGTASPAKPLDVTGDIRTSTGILFGTDTAAANTLDDYETGTFTPSVSAAASHSAQLGFYTKVGNLVTVTIKIGCALSSGSLIVSGLPFVASSASSYYPCGSFFGVIGFENYGDGGIATQIVPNQAVVQLYIQNNSSSSNYTAIDSTHVAASCNFSINISYTV